MSNSINKLTVALFILEISTTNLEVIGSPAFIGTSNSQMPWTNSLTLHHKLVFHLKQPCMHQQTSIVHLNSSSSFCNQISVARTCHYKNMVNWCVITVLLAVVVIVLVVGSKKGTVEGRTEGRKEERKEERKEGRKEGRKKEERKEGSTRIRIRKEE